MAPHWLAINGSCVALLWFPLGNPLMGHLGPSVQKFRYNLVYQMASSRQNSMLQQRHVWPNGRNALAHLRPILVMFTGQWIPYSDITFYCCCFCIIGLLLDIWPTTSTKWINFSKCDFFSPDPTLYCTASGVAASTSANVAEAQFIGERILKDMMDQDVNEYIFPASWEAKTLATHLDNEVNGTKVSVNLQLLFQRLSMVTSTQGEVFAYELCCYPLVLIDHKS